MLILAIQFIICIALVLLYTYIGYLYGRQKEAEKWGKDLEVLNDKIRRLETMPPFEPMSPKDLPK